VTTTLTDVPHRPMAALAKLRLGPSPFPGWYPADTLDKTADPIYVELTSIYKRQQLDLRGFKAAMWQVLRDLDGIGDSPNGTTPHMALVAHLAAETLRLLAEHKR
jgi:hypothetical protein